MENININTRLELTDTSMDIIGKMTEGNPGVLAASMELLQSNNMHCFLTLDAFGVYGSELYQLWNDCCKRDVRKMARVIKLVSTGKIDSSEFLRRIRQSYGESFDDLLK